MQARNRLTGVKIRVAAALAVASAPSPLIAQQTAPELPGGPGQIKSTTPADNEEGAQPLLLPDERRRPTDSDPFLTLSPADGGNDSTQARRVTSRSIERTPGERGVPILDRRRRFYDPVGIAVGNFKFFPSLTLKQNVTNNVFKQPNGDADTYTTGRAEAILRSDWSLHALMIDGFVQQDVHARYSSENNTTYLGRAFGRFNITPDDYVTAQLSHEKIALDRGGTGEVLLTREPVRYAQTSAEVGGRAIRGRISAQLKLAYDFNDYDDNARPDGAPIDESRRNFRNYEVTGKLGYLSSANRQIFVSASHGWRRFAAASDPKRDVNLFQILGGIEGEVTPVILGRAAIGYLDIHFKDPAFKAQKAVAFDVQLNFLVTELTTVKFEGQRALRNVANATSAAALVSSARFSVDHELLRNLIVSPGASYETANYLDSTQKAMVFSGDITARWLINPRWRATFSTSWRKRDAANFSANRDFSAFNLMAGITLQL